MVRKPTKKATRKTAKKATRKTAKKATRKTAKKATRKTAKKATRAKRVEGSVAVDESGRIVNMGNIRIDPKEASPPLPKADRRRGPKPRSLMRLDPLVGEDFDLESVQEEMLENASRFEDHISDRVSQTEIPTDTTLAELFTENEPEIRDLTELEKQHRKVAYLRAYIRTGRNDLSSRAAGVRSHVPYVWGDKDPEFARAWDYCRQRFAQVLEDAAIKRGVKGTLKPIFQEGKLVGFERVYSDPMLALMLKGAKPEKYGPNAGKQVESPDSKDRKGLTRENSNQIRKQLLGLEEKD